MRQPKQNKLSPPYNPALYIIIILDIKGNMVAANNGHHSISRNSSFFKTVLLQEGEEIPLQDMLTGNIGFESEQPSLVVMSYPKALYRSFHSRLINSVQRVAGRATKFTGLWMRSRPLHHYHVCRLTVRQMLVHTLELESVMLLNCPTNTFYRNYLLSG